MTAASTILVACAAEANVLRLAALPGFVGFGSRRRRRTKLQLLLGPHGFFLLTQLVPGVGHQRHMAAALPFALVAAHGVAAPTEALALVLPAAGMILGGGAATLPAAFVFSLFAQALAVIEAPAQMHFGFGNRDRGWLGVICLLFAAHGAARQAAQSCGSEPMKISSINGCSGHDGE